jgi:DNA repair exonuclease SbcCD nuclease subunit
MKIAIINDTHFGARGENPQVNNYFHKFYDNILFPYMEENKITTLLHLGDVVDRRKFMNFQIWNSWRTKFFDRLLGKKIDLHILLGNHDIYHKNTSDVNAMEELLRFYSNITIYKNAEEVNFDGLPLALVPWINSSNRESTLTFLEKTKASIVFGHLEIAGFEMDQGIICEGGMDKTPFNRFDKVYTGHFHHKSDDGHIFYLGNQVEITWADYGDPRGFHVFDTDTREIEFIENPNKLFHKIHYSDDTMDFEYWKKFDFTPFRESYIKIIILKKQNPYLFDVVLSSLYKVEPIDIMVVEDHREEIEEITLDQAEDVPTLLSKYIDNQPLDLDKNTIKSLIKELYIEAMNTEHNTL